jgi:hypothetical protein
MWGTGATVEWRFDPFPGEKAEEKATDCRHLWSVILFTDGLGILVTRLIPLFQVGQYVVWGCRAPAISVGREGTLGG